MQTSRRSFLSFSIFEGLCLKQVGVRTPQDIVANPTIYILTNNCCIATCHDRSYLEEVMVNWQYDAMLSWGCVPHDEMASVIKRHCPKLIKFKKGKDDNCDAYVFVKMKRPPLSIMRSLIEDVTRDEEIKEFGEWPLTEFEINQLEETRDCNSESAIGVVLIPGSPIPHFPICSGCLDCT